MCWKTYFGILTKKHTASKDIPVKKAFIVTRDEIKSLFYKGFTWTQDILHKTYLGNMRRFSIDGYDKWHYVWSIEEGFHSAKDVKIGNYYGERPTLTVSNGKGAGRVLNIAHKTNVKILDCIIPKGSKYYVNEYGEYVSDQLIVLPNQQNYQSYGNKN